MSKLPVDIIIPVYCETVEALIWFEECLHSAHEQNCYISICDDGSPYADQVAKIIQKYDDSVHAVFLERNHGVSHARNEAIAFATHDYILPLDCDDRLVGNAVRELYDFYNLHGQTPAYPDVSKFGEESVPHYELLNFSCEHVMKFVGFSSVNVFHSVEQWKSVGKYDESLSFYEDGEYNARLFARYCGVRYPHPLVEYRIHPNQRTKKYDLKSRQFATTILERIRRLDMPCPGCSKRRTGSSIGQNALSAMATQSQPAQKVTVNVASAPTHLPIEHEGKVLAVYIGGEGKGKHYYQGIVTKQPFKVTHGDYLYADPRDTRLKGEIGSRSMLVRVEKEPEVVKPVEDTVDKIEKVPDTEPVHAEPVEVVQPPVAQVDDNTEVRTPRKAVERTPAKKGKKR